MVKMSYLIRSWVKEELQAGKWYLPGRKSPTCHPVSSLGMELHRFRQIELNKVCSWNFPSKKISSWVPKPKTISHRDPLDYKKWKPLQNSDSRLPIEVQSGNSRSRLSGGNLQRVILAREFLMYPQFLMPIRRLADWTCSDSICSERLIELRRFGPGGISYFRSLAMNHDYQHRIVVIYREK